MAENFAEDDKIRQVTEAYALDAIDFARGNFKIKLDWSDRSIAHIETILGIMHDQIAQAKPTEEQVFGFAKMFGSYVGEVFRRNHGATWGLAQLGDARFPALRASGSAGMFWPWGRAQNRITNGPEDNVWHYYQILLERNGGGASSVSAANAPKKKSWWKRLWGT